MSSASLSSRTNLTAATIRLAHQLHAFLEAGQIKNPAVNLVEILGRVLEQHPVEPTPPPTQVDSRIRTRSQSRNPEPPSRWPANWAVDKAEYNKAARTLISEAERAGYNAKGKARQPPLPTEQPATLSTRQPEDRAPVPPEPIRRPERPTVSTISEETPVSTIPEEPQIPSEARRIIWTPPPEPHSPDDIVLTDAPPIQLPTRPTNMAEQDQEAMRQAMFQAVQEAIAQLVGPAVSSAVQDAINQATANQQQQQPPVQPPVQPPF
ncbi:MAG: hypothetical protein M1823_005991 [Watsoniomyces obsoletus]|nr:MAG: hypothetical protein M1823_005991 [Watsoniomyces obsoletus]